MALAAIKFRHAGSFRNTLFDIDTKWLLEKVDKTDKALLTIAGIGFLAFIASFLLI